ncbi:DUF1692-domain-containing protein [Punctularia strigosozonata HHB-11173 SS5]|uniref:DUF1692-domain-containing protein n=1 Tax=Punctularia strigosozonata (strain HHB-11173) TaxID=741275 RepID=R7S152_PUNST|nr:DUF1692-domain-containing protein [Punctularia strigosozonata HHB-11173 SS5]EIN03948.1 DUF1692-domain-containing protein [Punctularia strigosozonata HHB-11173 SS5]
MSTQTQEDDSLLSTLDSLAPESLKHFDAFPKLPASYKARSESRGLFTALVAFIAFFLVLNDLGEFIWGWPDYEFSVDNEARSHMNINVDMVVKMPCQYLSVDLRDAVGDRLYLSSAFRRDGTLFDIGQATALKEHAAQLSARKAVAQSRQSRGLFDVLLRRSGQGYKPTYNHQPDGGACRIYGTLQVKKVTANLHITTAGHGYASVQHVPHDQMNLSHVITEFSFGPYFPDITQPLDDSFEITTDPFIAYQYFLHVVPTTYVAPRSSPLKTAQYSVTHYTRVLEHGRGTPGIFFKFELDPLSITVNQRTTTLAQLFIRVIGVVGGIFVCAGYAYRITSHAISHVTGEDSTPGIVAAEASGASRGLRAKWGGGELRSRVVRQGSGWAVEGGSPYTSYAGTPVSAHAPSPSWSQSAAPSPSFGPPPSAGPYSAGFGPSASPYPPSSPMPPRSPYTPSGAHSRTASRSAALPTAATFGSQFGPSAPNTPNLYGHFPPTPNPAVNGFPPPSPAGLGINGNGHGPSPPPRTPSGGVNGVNGANGHRPAQKDPKKDD